VTVYAARVSPPSAPDPRHERLIHLLVDDVLARPIGELVAPRAAAESFRRLVLAVCDSDAAVFRILQPVLAFAEAAREDKARVRELVPAEINATLHDLAEWPYTPDRHVVGRLLASDPVKQLLRELVAESIEAFTGKLKTPLAGIVGLGKAVGERTGALGALANSMVGAAQDRLSKGSADVIDAALDALLARLIEQLSDPRHARDQAALRVALLDSGLALRARDLARELERARPVELAELVRGHVRAWARRPEATAEVVRLIDAALAADFAQPLGDAATGWGLHAAVRHALTDALGRLLLPFLGSSAFLAWQKEPS
jgi:hypothetical protein